MSLFRRAGAAIARFFESPADPAAAPNEFKLYSKDTAGVSQLYGRSDDGTVHQITPPSSGGGAVIFDDAVPADKVNIRSDRASNQSPIDNTKIQITNLGSQDGTVDPTAVGVTASTGTIGGGNDNSVTGAGAAVAGGTGNVVNGVASSIAGGDNNYIDGDYAHIAGGQFNYLFGVASHAEGIFTDGEADYCHVEGNGSFIDIGSTAAHAEGTSSIGSNSVQSHSESSSLIDNNCNQCHAEGNCHIDDGATFSHAEGDQGFIHANVHAGHVEGFNCDVFEEAGHAEGDSSAVDVGAFAGHAEGSSFCQGNRSHSEGDGTTSIGAASHSEGQDTISTGVASHAEGLVCFANGQASHAEGRNCIADGATSHAQGNLSHALRESQFAHASGSFQGFAIDEGNAQTSIIVMRGETTGLAINETVVLGFGVNDPPTTVAVVLENDKAYDFTITTTIGARQAGPVQVSRTIKTNISVRRVAGVAVIAATGVGDAYGDATTGTFVLTPTVAAGNLVLTFGSGGGPISKCFVAARVQFTEVRFQPT